MQFPCSTYRTGKEDILFTLRQKIPVNQTHQTKLTKSWIAMGDLRRLLVILVALPSLFQPSRPSNSFLPPRPFQQYVRTPPPPTNAQAIPPFSPPCAPQRRARRRPGLLPHAVPDRLRRRPADPRSLHGSGSMIWFPPRNLAKLHQCFHERLKSSEK